MKLPKFTIGIEEEYQIIDPETRELTSYVQEFLEEGKHIQAIEQRWVDERGEGATGCEILFSRLQQLYEERRALNAVTKYLNVKKTPLSQLVANDTFRAAVDAEITGGALSSVTPAVLSVALLPTPSVAVTGII